MNAPGLWTIDENGELEPDDDKAKTFDTYKAQREAGRVTYCLFDRNMPVRDMPPGQ